MVMLDQLPKPDGPWVQARPRVLILVDRRVLAELLSGALAAAGMQVLGTASSAAQAVGMAQDMKPDVVVIDVEMPGQDGLAVTRRLRELALKAAVVVLAAHPRSDWVDRLSQAGASAFIPTSSSLAQLVEVLGRLGEGNQMLRPAAIPTAPSPVSRPPTRASSAPGDMGGVRLTRREMEVLRCLGEAMSVKVIAETLGITLNTCRSYVKALLSKLDSGTTLEAVLSAQRLGLLP